MSRPVTSGHEVRRPQAAGHRGRGAGRKSPLEAIEVDVDPYLARPGGLQLVQRVLHDGVDPQGSDRLRRHDQDAGLGREAGVSGRVRKPVDADLCDSCAGKAAVDELPDDRAVRGSGDQLPNVVMRVEGDQRVGRRPTEGAHGDGVVAAEHGEGGLRLGAHRSGGLLDV
jgi:hypothetical protein